MLGVFLCFFGHCMLNANGREGKFCGGIEGMGEKAERVGLGSSALS